MRLLLLLLALLPLSACDPDGRSSDPGGVTDADGDGSPASEDCDDDAAAVHPGGIETCNRTDDDCDGEIDEDAVDGTTWYADLDGDGAPGDLQTTTACTAPAGYGPAPADCDDGDATAHPGAIEVCDDADDDCDGAIDEGFDADADGVSTCDGDCDDSARFVFPGAPELCNGTDDDCDEVIDEDPSFFPDEDGDGFGDASATPTPGDCAAPPPGLVSDWSDCDDADAAISPAAQEVCDETDTDEDCDGASDDADSDASQGTKSRWWVDADGDGYGAEDDDGELYCDAPSGVADNHNDCDDGSAAAHPGNPEELCGDGVDNDCDGTPGACGLYGELDLADADAIFVAEEETESVAGGGDVNGDGYADLLIGTRDGDNSSGIAYLVHGPVTGEIDLADADARLLGVAKVDRAGSSVSIAGDVNADGFDDLLVGAPEVDDAGSNAGAAYLVYGPVRGDVDLALADATLLGDEAGDKAGEPVAIAGDVDGDGYADLLVGAPASGEGSTGAVWLVRGPVSGSVDLSSADAKLIGESAADYAGYSVAGGGDVNADGFVDVLVGSGNWRAAWLVYGPVAGELDLGRADAWFVGEDNNGTSVAIVGDVDADGYDDILLGAYDDAEGGERAGAAYLFFGPVSGELELATADARLIGGAGDPEGDLAGWAVAPAGDVNGDGYDDILVGALGDDDGGNYAGAAFLLYGPVAGDIALDAAGAKLVGEEAWDYAGASVAAAGDVNGDGYDDVLVGSINGSSYLVYGGPGY